MLLFQLMPAQATWYLRVPEIVAQLHSSTAPPFLDRPAIENLFRLRRRQAIRLMGTCGGYQVGKTYLVDRCSLLRFLDELTRTGIVDEAVRRKRRICEALDASANFVAAQRTRIQVDSGLRDKPTGLPPGIELIGSGKIQISYEGATDLLARIADLAGAAAHDFPRFQKIVEAGK
jgi:hypothetical protein